MRPRLAVALSWPVLALGVTACGEESVAFDDGTQGVPLAGLGPQVEAAGVEVLDDAAPVDATAAEVVAALEAEQLDDAAAIALDEVPGTLAVDADGTAGLVGLAGAGGSDDATVVLVFSGPAAAAVHAASDPEVFADDAVGEDDQAFLAGNLLAYVADRSDDDAVRTALTALAGRVGVQE